MGQKGFPAVGSLFSDRLLVEYFPAVQPNSAFRSTDGRKF